ncbi:fumarylacetoacetate hydrolase family protein [Rhodocaloribacter litoris]|uniref:fumarylacetoacetate hydrolase family protein n=1 Tax=Rhodocaloribacter litoris TaxID=2558931 RepID=UPI00142317D7|nr:fumarylacetoacetate hydrolase family protein [Rhodocaloribacter litoris]QXD16005.1 fumarylacetoacetate hydrolase family protein [Rhodocaloribacter litoris]
MIELLLPSHGRDVAVGKILCIGRNYAKHAAEMQSEVPEEPIVFLKPSTALVGHGGTVILPPQSQDVHHEVELVAVIGRGGKNIPEEKALEHVDAYAVGLDMTARDLQAEAKRKGQPWTVAKGFDTFAPLGPLVDARRVRDPQNLEIRLTVNGEVRQQGHTRDMVFSVARLIAYCSRIFTLLPGNLLYTGTPDGVGPVRDGDVLEAQITGFPVLRVKVRRNG